MNYPDKDYDINIPVFTSEGEKIGTAFEFTLDEIIEGAISAIEKYNTENCYSIENQKKNKFHKRVIGNIITQKVSLGKDPALLLNVSSYIANRKSKLIKDDVEDEILIEEKDKIGGEGNFMLMYPKKINPKDEYCWLVLIYDDPYKSDSDEAIAIAKLVMKNIIKQKITNVKLSSIIDEFKDQLVDVTLTLNSIEYPDTPYNPELRTYQSSCKTAKKEVYKYSDMPSDLLISGILNDTKKLGITKRFIKWVFRTSEDNIYSISQDVKEFGNSLNSCVEKHFNYKRSILPIEFPKIHDKEFILSVFELALTKYLCNG